MGHSDVAVWVALIYTSQKVDDMLYNVEFLISFS